MYAKQFCCPYERCSKCVSCLATHRSDVASSMRLATWVQDCVCMLSSFAVRMNDVALDAFSEYGYKTAQLSLLLSSSVSCTNDVALVAFSECRNRTAYICHCYTKYVISSNIYVDFCSSKYALPLCPATPVKTAQKSAPIACAASISAPASPITSVFDIFDLS